VRRLILAAAVTLGILVLTPSPSWACSCASTGVPQQVRGAVTIASGTVDWTSTDGQTRTFKVDFDGVYKGRAAASEKLSTNANEASCGVGELATGKRYLFFIDGMHPGAMRIGLCGGTTPYDDAIAHRIESLTGPPGTPLAAPSTAASSSDGDPSRAKAIALSAAGLLVVAGAVAFAVRRQT
jgi:hypothetical protein